MSERPYDVDLYAASWFVGKQTVQYFANHVPLEQAPWAIALPKPPEVVMALYGSRE